MRRKLFAAVAVLALTTTAVLAHPGKAQRRMDRREAVARIAEKLELTPAQIGAIREIRESQRAKQLELRDQMKSAAVEYRNLRGAGNPNADRAMDRLRELRDETRARRLAGRADIEQILTPEQREKIRQRRERR